MSGEITFSSQPGQQSRDKKRQAIPVSQRALLKLDVSMKKVNNIQCTAFLQLNIKQSTSISGQTKKTIYLFQNTGLNECGCCSQEGCCANATFCSGCAAGQFQPNKGQNNCNKCPNGTSTQYDFFFFYVIFFKMFRKT